MCAYEIVVISRVVAVITVHYGDVHGVLETN